jgi:hypothetical protein
VHQDEYLIIENELNRFRNSGSYLYEMDQ